MKEAQTRTETDLYSIDIDVSAMNLQLSDSSQIGLADSPAKAKVSDSKDSNSLIGLPQLALYTEPIYETFFCPLTKRVMDDPVTIESGVTYESSAIIKWFDKFRDHPDKFICPKSGRKLKSRVLSTNVALKATIDEWKERNEAARIKLARAALSLASTENMVLEAINDLRSLCKRKQRNRAQVCSIGIIPLLANFLEYKSRSVRHATLELLRQLAEDDGERKGIIAKTVKISTIIKMLSSNHGPVRHSSASLLFELSTTPFFCDKIGTVSGGILMLIAGKYRGSSDSFSSETADKILKNLETRPRNIKLMAENGYWEPLLTHLIEGNEEMRMEMASYLEDIVIGHDSNTYVAERASPVLIQMVHSGNSLSRHAAFKALKQFSAHHPNTKKLVAAGIMPILIAEMFKRTIHNEPMNSETEAATILANILNSGLDLGNFQVNTHGHTMASDYIVYNIICRIKNSTEDELNINLVRILLGLIEFSKALSTIVSIVKETEASYNLIELINTKNEELGVASIKLLIILSDFMGHTLSDRLCKTKGHPECLIQNPTDITSITEKEALSSLLLARLPYPNLRLNLALVNSNAVPIVMRSISQIQTQITGTGSSRHASTYLEGLVGILVRLTTTLYDHQILRTARTYDFASVLAKVLTRSFTGEVQKLSAIGLENLSKQSISLSRPPQRNKSKILKVTIFQKQMSINLPGNGEKFTLCPIHEGVCSAKETFCLLDAGAVERLVGCLDHENVEIVEASVSALSTLLDERVNVENSVSLLSEKRAIQQLLNVVKEQKDEALLQKAFWMIERFLTSGGDESISCIYNDKFFPAILVSAFHHGGDCTKQLAQNILRHLNKMETPFSTYTCIT